MFIVVSFLVECRNVHTGAEIWAGRRPKHAAFVCEELTKNDSPCSFTSLRSREHPECTLTSHRQVRRRSALWSMCSVFLSVSNGPSTTSAYTGSDRRRAAKGRAFPQCKRRAHRFAVPQSLHCGVKRARRKRAASRLGYDPMKLRAQARPAPLRKLGRTCPWSLLRSDRGLAG